MANTVVSKCLNAANTTGYVIALGQSCTYLPEERRDPCAPGACYNVTGRGEAGSGDSWRQATRTECVNCGEGRTTVVNRQGRQTHAEDMRRDIETGDLWWRSARPVPAQGSPTQRAVDRAGDRLQRELMLFDARRPR